MRHFIDKKAGMGHAMIFDSPLECITMSAQANIARPDSCKVQFDGHYAQYAGRRFGSWEEVVTAFQSPWEEGRAKVENFAGKLSTQLPTPKSRKRRARWSEVEGDVCPDRWMNGDPDYFRNVQREMTAGSAKVALLINMCAAASMSADDIFWRTAAAVSVIDILENAGYMCDVWFWEDGLHVYNGAYPNQFTAARIKGAGDPIDTDTMINSLSGWFLRYGIYGSYNACPGNVYSGSNWYGRAAWMPERWRQYIETESDCHEFHIDALTSEEAALANANKILAAVAGVENLTH